MTRGRLTLPDGARSAAIRTLRWAPLSDTYKVFSSGESESVRLYCRGDKRSDKPIEINQEDSLKFKLAWFVANVTRVGNVDTPCSIDSDIVGTVKSLVIVVIGERANHAVALGDRDAPTTTRVGALGDDQPPRASKIKPLARPLGSRKTVVLLVFGSKRKIRLPMSENRIEPS